MPIEPTVFQNIVQGGSFALIVLLACWIMFRLEPRIREMIEKKDALHAETVAHIVTTGREQVEMMVTRFTEMIQKSHDDCREERRDSTETMQKEMKLNREARHDDSNKLQEAVVELYELMGVVKNKPNASSGS